VFRSIGCRDPQITNIPERRRTNLIRRHLCSTGCERTGGGYTNHAFVRLFPRFAPAESHFSDVSQPRLILHGFCLPL
jgi:hypothetical protein